MHASTEQINVTDGIYTVAMSDLPFTDLASASPHKQHEAEQSIPVGEYIQM